MTSDEYDINRLWQDARLDQALLDAERRLRPASVCQSGDDGLGSGAESAPSMDCPVAPGEWTADDTREYAGWSDDVNRQHEAETEAIYAAEELERLQREADERINDR